MDLYAENILDHYRNPRGKGALQQPTVAHEEVNVACGDALTVELKLEKNQVADLAWTGTGCAISQAGMSILNEELRGKSSDEIEALKREDIIVLLGVPISPRRLKCAMLCLHTVKNALRKARGEEPQSWLMTVGLEATD
ncbi:MAG: iron-sulfur cluster assembly scaffold protein [Candidatus Peregrinibacteria bacterium]|nr:iron-sulfur cluster assembly scaffold protein [Candidatus Peregrinibacteria bacterium]